MNLVSCKVKYLLIQIQIFREMNLTNQNLKSREWTERIFLAIIFAGFGSLIMIVFSPWHPILGKVQDYLGRISIVALLLLIFYFLRARNQFKNYQQIIWGLFIMALAVSLDWVFGLYLIDSLGVDGNTHSGFALLKLNECIRCSRCYHCFYKIIRR